MSNLYKNNKNASNAIKEVYKKYLIWYLSVNNLYKSNKNALNAIDKSV